MFLSATLTLLATQTFSSYIFHLPPPPSSLIQAPPSFTLLPSFFFQFQLYHTHVHVISHLLFRRSRLLSPLASPMRCLCGTNPGFCSGSTAALPSFISYCHGNDPTLRQAPASSTPCSCARHQTCRTKTGRCAGRRRSGLTCRLRIHAAGAVEDAGGHCRVWVTHAVSDDRAVAGSGASHS
uniref:Uncharacterized protein TCIL3000_6_870 n=1 Tax=Trypanosoma congolense (strain IL3000) TaxID=1068625 RepID=G0UN95_TRYCI|nr:unnamed protein product [Trypanosoma congolense IL3000]